MPTPEALVQAAQGAGARINRRKPASAAGSASSSTSATPAPSSRFRQDLASAADGKLTGRGGGTQELGAAAQRRLAAFRPSTAPSGDSSPNAGVSTDAVAGGGSQDEQGVPAWKGLANAGIAGQGSRAANMAKLAETQGRTMIAPVPPTLTAPVIPPGEPAAAANVAREISRLLPTAAPGGGMPGAERNANAAGAGIPGGPAGADAIVRGLQAFRPRGLPPNAQVGGSPLTPEGIAALRANTPGSGPGSMEANILPAVTDVATANPMPGGNMTKPMFGAPTGTAGPAPWDDLAAAVTRRPRPRFPEGGGGGRGMGDLGGEASY